MEMKIEEENLVLMLRCTSTIFRSRRELRGCVYDVPCLSVYVNYVCL